MLTSAFRKSKFSGNECSMIVKLLLGVFLSLSVVLPISYKVLSGEMFLLAIRINLSKIYLKGVTATLILAGLFFLLTSDHELIQS